MKNLIPLIAVTATLTGCGTVFSGTTQPVAIVGPAPAARVTVDGADVGAQRQVTLKRGKDHTVNAEQPGCRNATATVGRNFNGVTAFNLVNPFGWLTDFITGAAWNLDPSVTVQPDCGGAAVSAAAR